MSYANFTLKDIKSVLSLSINERVSLFFEAAEYSVSDHLLETLKENVPLALAISTEKARSELIIAPVLAELRKLLNYKISLFSGIELDVDNQRGLNGICDFVISRSDEQLFLSSPIITIVEAKNENIKGGLAQCIAEMYAAMLFNEKEGNATALIYGAVTTGSTWKFIELHNEMVFIDLDEYYIDNVGKIIGILVKMIGKTN
jgi:hypothetical protein